MRVIGYLCSEFPALSHTFISREIDILCKEGFTIYTASVNAAKGLEKMDPSSKELAARTYYVKATPKWKMAGIFLSYALRLPRFISVLAFSLRLTWLSGPRSLVKAIGYFAQGMLLHSWARKKGIGHIHVHFANPAATVAAIAERFGYMRFSMSVHGPDEFYDVEGNNLRYKIGAAVFVRCISDFCRSQLMRLSSPELWYKFHVVRCGLYRGEFPMRLAEEGPRRRILCVGRLCPSKGQALLVEAARILRERRYDFHMTLLGGGEDQDQIERLVRSYDLLERVTVAGSVGHARVRDEMRLADLFVLPSFAEGIPIVLMEAMASGIPVVSTAIAGIPELIEDGKEGWLLPASNLEALVSILEAFIIGRIDASGCIANAVAKVLSLYDVERNTRILGGLFDALGEAS